MKEIIVKVRDEDSELVTQLLEKLGAEVTERKAPANRSSRNEQKDTKKSHIGNISPTYLFGKWKNLDLDAKKLRDRAWDRNDKFL